MQQEKCFWLLANPAIRLRFLLPASPKPPLGSEGAEGEDKGSSLLPPQG